MAAGRWHTQGRPVTYCSLHPAAALIEWIVHLELSIAEVPATIPYVVVESPDAAPTERVDPSVLTTDWKANVSETQSIGDAWLRSRRGVLLRVPSAIVPESENVLINPSHADAHRIRIVRTFDEPFDPRLLVGRHGS